MNPNPVVISCCMIVKNEESRLEGCLRSIIHEVDEVIIVDTGSTDRTLEIASKFSPKVRIFQFEWTDDFSAARNASLSHAKGDWILCIDADERLNPLGRRNILRELAESGKADAYSVGIRSLHWEDNLISGSFDWAIRFFKRFPDIEFTGIIHESVEPYFIQKGAVIQRAPFIIDHFGYAEPGSAWYKTKIERNFRLALKHLKKNPGDPYILYHLALAAYQQGKIRAASRIVNKAYSILTSTDNSTRRQLSSYIFNLRSRLLFEEGNYSESIDCADRSLRLIPWQKSARLLKGIAYMKQNRWDEAIKWLEEALQFAMHESDPIRNPSLLSMEFSIPLTTLKYLIGYCYEKTGRHNEAIYALGNNQPPGNVLTLAVLSLEQGRITDVMDYLTMLTKTPEIHTIIDEMVRIFHHAISIITDSSLPELERTERFLVGLAARPDWKDLLPPFIQAIVSQRKTLCFIKKEPVSHPIRARIDILLCLQSGHITEAVRRSFAAVQNALKKQSLSSEEIEMLKFHAVLLTKAGREREASALIKRIGNYQER